MYLDRYAAGFGWYTGIATAGAYLPVGQDYQPVAGGPAAGRMDLLSVLLHELGYRLGPHGVSAAYGDVMLPDLWGSRTRPLPLTWASVRLARIR